MADLQQRKPGAARRGAVLSRWVRGQSRPQIADAMGLSVRTVARDLAKARATMKLPTEEE